MKIQFEAITPDSKSSFHLSVNPRMNDFFFWHFHPEIELTFITGTDGTRHVGHHISKYKGSDLVLIGSNIPHLNFDYGLKHTHYQKIVLHFKPDFMQQALNESPELESIRNLFMKAMHCICVQGKVKQEVGMLMLKLEHQSNFEQLISVLKIFHLIAGNKENKLLHSKPIQNQYTQKEQDRLQALYKHIDAHYQKKITIAQAAKICHMAHASFCRYFKKVTQLTFTRFLNQYRIHHAKRLLMQEFTVSETCYACGFESLSYFNRTFKKITKLNPIEFKKKMMK